MYLWFFTIFLDHLLYTLISLDPPNLSAWAPTGSFENYLPLFSDMLVNFHMHFVSISKIILCSDSPLCMTAFTLSAIFTLITNQLFNTACCLSSFFIVNRIIVATCLLWSWLNIQGGPKNDPTCFCQNFIKSAQRR